MQLGCLVCCHLVNAKTFSGKTWTDAGIWWLWKHCLTKHERMLTSGECKETNLLSSGFPKKSTCRMVSLRSWSSSEDWDWFIPSFVVSLTISSRSLALQESRPPVRFLADDWSVDIFGIEGDGPNPNESWLLSILREFSSDCSYPVMR